MKHVVSPRDWTTVFPGLEKLEPDVARTLREDGRIISVPEGTVIFGPGRLPENYLLLTSGTVRVFQASESGREIVLYRVSAGESCTLTTACLMGHQEYHATGIAETDVEAVAIPSSAFDSLIARSTAFRRFVFSAFSLRITDIFRLVEEVAFSRLDIRLAHKLIELADADGRIEMTHQQLASELGTAREVISRQLHEFQRRNWVETSRGALTITSPDALKALARAL